MADPRVENLAKILVHYSVKVKKGDDVMISGPMESEPLALEVYREVLRAGGYPLLMPTFARAAEIFYEEAMDHHFDYVSPYKMKIFEEIKCQIGLWSDVNTRAMTNVPPAKLGRIAKTNRPISDIMMKRSATKDLRWVGTVYPTAAMAQEASMSLSEYERFVYSATYADKPDAVAEWKKVSKRQDGMIKVLSKVKTLQFLGEDTDLKMSVKGRKWINCDGENNMPDGEVFTAPVENSVEGTIRFTYPGIYMGKEIENIALTFKKGKVVKGTASKGEDLLNQLLNLEENNRRLGEVAIGTNYGITKFTKNMLFDEKIGGTVHMALGSGYPETGSTNVASIHWDILKDMKKGGEILADGKTVYKNGKWVG